MLLLSTAYLPPLQYYAHLYAAHHAVEDRGEHFLKQTYRNRCYIATPTGAQPLTIPVVRDGAAHTAVRDIRISDHGNWRHLHWAALVSAYENSPYFEYYADDFRPFYERKYEFLADFNAELRDLVLNLLSLERNIDVSLEYVNLSAEESAEKSPLLSTDKDECKDLRTIISPKTSLDADIKFVPHPYYQVFAERTGFIPNLSIVDLLFNMGPESRMILKNSLL